MSTEPNQPVREVLIIPPLVNLEPIVPFTAIPIPQFATHQNVEQPEVNSLSPKLKPVIRLPIPKTTEQTKVIRQAFSFQIQPTLQLTVKNETPKQTTPRPSIQPSSLALS